MFFQMSQQTDNSPCTIAYWVQAKAFIYVLSFIGVKQSHLMENRLMTSFQKLYHTLESEKGEIGIWERFAVV